MLIDRAAKTTREWIDGGGLDQPGGVPHQMTNHAHR
jgi:hypothetical protein